MERYRKMKKSLIIIVCIFAFSNASARWVFVSSGNAGLFYVEKSSFQRTGDIITAWVKTNYDERDELGNLSVKAQESINCKKRESITRYFIAYREHDNKGGATDSFKPKDSWSPIAPQTVWWDIYEYVCNSK
jgi:hypothetical protein